jgi:hypothetical protein
MTLDELRAKLDELGIPHDTWGAAGGRTVQPPRIEKYKELLVKIRTLLEGQVGKDKDKLSELHEVLMRAKHGGGA